MARNHIHVASCQDQFMVPESVTATLALMGLGVLGMATRRRTA